MDEKLIAELIVFSLQVVCLGAITFLLLVKWRRAKRAGENPRIAIEPFWWLVIALILTQLGVVFLDRLKSFLWIIIGVALLLMIIGIVAISRQKGQDQLKTVDKK